MRRSACLVVVVLVAAALLGFGKPARAEVVASSIVQKFYGAWMKHLKSWESDPSGSGTVEASMPLFDRDLGRAVQYVMNLDRVTSHVQGYNRDPFFYTRDTVYAFRLGKTSVHKNHAFVPVYITPAKGGRPAPPERLSATVKLERGGALGWRIIDVTYPSAQGGKPVEALRAWTLRLCGESQR